MINIVFLLYDFPYFIYVYYNNNDNKFKLNLTLKWIYKNIYKYYKYTMID